MQKQSTLKTHIVAGEAVEYGEEKTLEGRESEGRERPETEVYGRDGERSRHCEDVVGAKQRQQHERRLHSFPIHHTSQLSVSDQRVVGHAQFQSRKMDWSHGSVYAKNYYYC